MEIPQALSDFSFVLVYLVAAASVRPGSHRPGLPDCPPELRRRPGRHLRVRHAGHRQRLDQVAVIYYLFALLFLAFDVDVLFLFPVLLAYGKGYAWLDFVEITIFIGILSLVLVYAWCRGVFSWKRKQVTP